MPLEAGLELGHLVTHLRAHLSACPAHLAKLFQLRILQNDYLESLYVIYASPWQPVQPSFQ